MGVVKPDKAIIVYFHTMVTANRAGKEALKQLLDKLPVAKQTYERITRGYPGSGLCRGE